VTSGLKHKAAPHNPAPAATNLMLNRSKIVIDVDTPSFPLETSPFEVVQQNLCRTDFVLRPRQLLTPAAKRATRRTGLFPNGDVGQVCTPMPGYRTFTNSS
jgi:hypothetical protein